MNEPVYIARCPVHGWQGGVNSNAHRCWCETMVEQVAMIPLADALTDEMVKRASRHLDRVAVGDPAPRPSDVRAALLAAGPWTGVKPLFTKDEIDALVWATHRGYAALDDGFSHPRDSNREILASAREKLEVMRGD